MENSSVFVLEHTYEDKTHEDSKLIGVYASREDAESAVERKLAFPGFRDYPNGFSIDEYELNNDAWSEGFGV